MSQNQVQNLLDSLADGVLLVTVADRVVRLANPAACALMGVEHARLLGSRFKYPLDDRSRFSAPGPRTIEMRVADAAWHEEAAKLLSLRDITRDATERALERNLWRARSRSERGQLAASIAHELGDPASTLAANRAVLRDYMTDFEAMCADPRVPRELRERYEVAQTLHDMRAMLDDDATSLDRIRSCLRELGTGSQETVDKPALVDLRDVVAQARAVMAATHGSEFQLECRFADVPGIMADGLKLTLLLVHLFENASSALKGSRKGDRTIQLAVERRADEVCIEVRDHGRGLSREHVQRIFEPVRVAGAGHNLAASSRLVVAAEIASAHNGRVELHSQLGEGSVIRVWLPVDTKLAPARTENRALPGQVRARVLWLSSDAERSREVHTLLDRDHDVVDSTGNQHALQLLDRDRDYDVILADINANSADAMALHKALAADAPELAQRMVLIAPAEVPPKVRRFVETSHLLLLDKPLSNSTLLDVVERMSF